MKVLGILGSSRRDGHTNDLLDVALRGAAEGGAQVEKAVLLDFQVQHIHDLCKWADLGRVIAFGGSRGTALKNAEAVRQAYELGRRFAGYTPSDLHATSKAG